MKYSLALAVMLAASAAQAEQAAEIWSIDEGAGPSMVHGTWAMILQDDGVNLVGKGSMSDGRGMVKPINVAGDKQGDVYVLHGVDGPEAGCIYRGVLYEQGTKIGGSKMCQGMNSPWVVTIKK